MTFNLKRSALLGFTLMALLGISSCVYFQELIGIGPKKPKVTLQSVAVTKASLSDIDLEVELLVKNPNGYALKLNRMVYKATALKEELAEGKYLESFEVPAEGESTVRIPLTVNLEGARNVMQKMLQSPKKLKVLLEALITFDSPIGDIDLEFTEEQPLKFQ